jgi:hypothetical protein
MTQFHLDPSNRLIIEGYAKMRPFSSFLPGIAGPMGIPLWVFYVNRGQAMASFGVESKDSPIMEYQPANKAYQNTSYTGFRTFIKITSGEKCVSYEPFSPWNEVDAESQRMVIGPNVLELQELNTTLNLQTGVRYFILPNEPFAGLVRQVTIKNLANSAISVELLDGIPKVIPYGVNNFLLKEMGRTVEAWMEVFNLEANVPFYRLRASVIDRAEVETYQAGHFALAFVEDGKPLQALVDPALIFGQDTALYAPNVFFSESLDTLLGKRQITCGRTPCGFFAHRTVLPPGESIILYVVFGHINSLDRLENNLSCLMQISYLDTKYEEAVTLVDDITQVVATHTSLPMFDAYCRQNFLDNILRGGWPVRLGEHIYPIYSRKHGDLERDYNAFFLAAEPFSQGEGSYRDVNQNCRGNVLLNPDIGDFDIRNFMSLVQADGYNPRSIKGEVFSLTPEKQKLVLAYVRQPEKLQDVLDRPFTPGKLLRGIFENNVELLLPPQEFLMQVLTEASQHLSANFHEGYWIDHWEYNLDLIESYLAVYPDRKDDLLFKTELPFFDSPMLVQPRSKKYVLVNGMPRQLNSLIEDKEKAARISTRGGQTQWLRDKDGNIFRTTLFSKMVLIALLKFATLDPWGMGIEMEAGRPGWDDALNGLPGLFGSGMAETYELVRWLNFLLDAIPVNKMGGIKFPQEAADLLEEVFTFHAPSSLPASADIEYLYWDAISTAREAYRQRTRLGFVDVEIHISFNWLHDILTTFQKKARSGIERAEELNNGLPPTYFAYNVDEYDILPDYDPHGYPYIHPRRFTPKILPLFLEGPTRAYKILQDEDSAHILYERVKGSLLFDKKLHMYKLNASLESQPHDIGRARAFPPGWLENESIWLHMEYKYLLEILKAGLFEQFFADMKNTLVPFFDPHIYGRSPLENSSFLVSSAHPDETLHGAGFVARLSGSTAEFISIWNVMMAGKHPFIMQDGQLCFTLRPALPGWLFTDDGIVSFRFLGRCIVTYHNQARRDIPALEPSRIVFTIPDGHTVEIDGPDLKSPYAEMVRNGQIDFIDAWF